MTAGWGALPVPDEDGAFSLHAFPAVTETEFREAFRRLPAGVTVVTAAGADGPVGFTATSVTSVSARPPLVSFNLSRTSSSWPTIAATRHLGVHLLGAEQRELAATFARSGIDRFAEPTRWAPGPHEVPLLADVAGWLLVRIVDQVAAGDSTIVVGRVEQVGGLDAGRAPLLHHDGSFAALAASGP